MAAQEYFIKSINEMRGSGMLVHNYASRSRVRPYSSSSSFQWVKALCSLSPSRRLNVRITYVENLDVGS
jgi:hypothetical protein